MATPRISKEFKFLPTPATVSSKVADHIETLKTHGFDTGKILDIYVESQTLSGKINRITNPMEYTSSYLGTSKGNPEIKYRDFERVYNAVVRDWCKIKPSSFLQQFDAYVHQGANDTGVENGFVREQFLWFSCRDEKLLVIDPHPVVMDSLFKEDRDITFAFTDDRIYNAYLNSKADYKLGSIHDLPRGIYHRVLYFASSHTSEQIQNTLDGIRHALVAKMQTNLYIVMQTRYLEKRRTEKEFWNYIHEHHTIQKIVLIDANAVNTQPKKRCLVILHNSPGNCKEIHVQKTRLINATTFVTLEFRRVPYASFADRDRTLSEMYNTDYTDYSEPNRREKPVVYKFSDEISIWVSCTKSQNGKYRPYYSLYDYPTAEQLRKNTLPRGSAIKTRIPGKWYCSKEEAIESAEGLLLQDEKLARAMRKAITKEFGNKPVTAKTQLFLHWEELKKVKGFDEALCTSLFFDPNSAERSLCALMVGTETEDTIKEIMDYQISQSGCSETRTELFLKQIQLILDFSVLDGRYNSNPIRNLLNNRHETHKNKSDMRRGLVRRSFSKETERALTSHLLSDEENRTLAQMLLTKYFTRLPNSILCALTWGDYLYNPELGLSQFSITKAFPFRSQRAEPIMPEERRRFIPVASIVSEMLNARVANGEVKSYKHPLFTQPGSATKPITARQLQSYFNKVVEKLNLPEYKIMLFDDEKPPESNDINDYGGDILLSNFDYHGYYDALLEPEELDFIAGRKPRTTEAQYYCDYNNVYLQLMMRVKLDRWVASLFSNEVDRQVHCMDVGGNAPLTIAQSSHGSLCELYIDLDIQDEIIDEEMVLSIQAQYGGSISIDFYEEE